MPTFNLALGLRMVRCAADVIHAVVVEPFGKVGRDVTRTVVAEQPMALEFRKNHYLVRRSKFPISAK